MSKTFTKKSEEELKKMPLHRLKSYYKAEKTSMHSKFSVCECCGYYDYELKYDLNEKIIGEHEIVRDAWHKYLMFVKAILKTRENNEKTCGEPKK